MREKFEQELRSELLKAINSLEMPLSGFIAQRANHRLCDVAANFPPFLSLLTEPWLLEPISADTRNTLIHCGHIHLYARILDDAIDENLPVYRQNLLRAQPMLWRSVQALGVRYPDMQCASEALIAEAVHAVTEDDRGPSPRHWGAKNHHLLLAPLLLSGDDSAYGAAKTGLSGLIALSQAGDEWSQGVIQSGRTIDALLRCFPIWLAEPSIVALRQHGWHGAAHRLLHDGQELLGMIQKTFNHIHTGHSHDEHDHPTQ